MYYKRNRGYKARQERRKVALLIQGVLSVLLLLLLMGVFFSAKNLAKVKQQNTHQSQVNQKLSNDLENVKPTAKSPNVINFNLHTKEQTLNKNYNILVSYAFGRINNSSQLTTNQKVYKKYFGQSGYKQLKSTVTFKQGKQIKMLANKNKSTKVYFGKFNKNDKSVPVAIYTNYDLATKSKGYTTGSTLITVTYHFDSQTSTDFEIQTTTNENYY